MEPVSNRRRPDDRFFEGPGILNPTASYTRSAASASSSSRRVRRHRFTKGGTATTMAGVWPERRRGRGLPDGMIGGHRAARRPADRPHACRGTAPAGAVTALNTPGTSDGSCLCQAPRHRVRPGGGRVREPYAPITRPRRRRSRTLLPQSRSRPNGRRGLIPDPMKDQRTPTRPRGRHRVMPAPMRA